MRLGGKVVWNGQVWDEEWEGVCVRGLGSGRGVLE